MGSNMAEQHPVGFQWVMEAKERGAKLVHVDPRFTRTSAMADSYVALRPGSDIAFLGGIINYVLENDLYFHDYVRHYTNAPVKLKDAFVDTEDAGGLFSGWDPEEGAYATESWSYGASPPEMDETMTDPRCVLQVLKRHFARYTPEMVSETCGCSPEQLIQTAKALAENSGPERTSAICYAVGWTQHTTGVQIIRAGAILQLLLGNIGRPGGGILALRGHANIQGSTDIPTLYDILPGYIPMPRPGSRYELESFLSENSPSTGVWARLDAYVVSLLKAWWGDAATADNDFGFGYLPRVDGDHSHYATMMKMLDGGVKGFFCVGQNPAVGSANAKLQRLAMAKLDWLVVRDLTEIETAAFWYDSPEIESGEARPEDIATEVFFLPAAAHTEKDGSFTNTQRLMQWRYKALEPPQDCRSELHWVYHLGRLLREKLAGSTHARDRGLLDLTWDYPLQGPQQEPDSQAVLQEISGRAADGSFLGSFDDLAADGSTACGSWIHCGVYRDGVNQTARKKPHTQQNWIAREWGWAWPKDTRVLYNRASADPQGRPWSERKRYVWWDEEQGTWAGLGDSPDFPLDKAPGYRPEAGARAVDAIPGDSPFIVHPDGLGWLFAPSGLVDGPLPTHYEAQESPFENSFYAQQQSPTRQVFRRDENHYNPSAPEPGAEVFPFVLSTYRLTEHHTAGGMSRTVAYLAELQPEFFCEVSPELAAERGLEHAGWATIVTARNAVEARVMVTRRLAPLEVNGTKMHLVGLPYHWGEKGLVTGDSANELLPLALDNNTHINEYKALTCDIQPGRRPRGPERLSYVEAYRQRAGSKG